MALALDFDGVIADSVVECMAVSKKVYSELDLSSNISTKDILEKFRKLRAYARNSSHFFPIMKAIEENIKIDSDAGFFDYT
ncbi:MAG: hypothetical protein Q8R04_00475 [Nanoarchaeota archaeon]|nr:hypothetical protein [Nanoarchaeota archaeon]